MTTFPILPVRSDPLPYVMAEDFLDPTFYRELADSFPICPANSGPTGFSYFWGDTEYETLLEEVPAWRRLFEIFHSQEFVDHVLAQFAQTFASEATADLSNARYVPYCETREDKERPRLSSVEHAPDELWVRMDILQGRVGYKRAPHLDHRRRAISMLIYFCDAEESGIVGGDLILHPPHSSGRPEVIRPRHNRMVMFPCCNASLHSVSPITAQLRPRNFVQVTVSSSIDLWEPLPGTFAARTLSQPRAIFASAARRFKRRRGDEGFASSR